MLQCSPKPHSVYNVVAPYAYGFNVRLNVRHTCFDVEREMNIYCGHKLLPEHTYTLCLTLDWGELCVYI